MVTIFKVLASITAWILFIGGLATLVSVLLMTYLSGQLYLVGSPPPMEFYVGLGISAITLAAAAYVMQVRKLLEIE